MVVASVERGKGVVLDGGGSESSGESGTRGMAVAVVVAVAMVVAVNHKIANSDKSTIILECQRGHGKIHTRVMFASIIILECQRGNNAPREKLKQRWHSGVDNRQHNSWNERLSSAPVRLRDGGENAAKAPGQHDEHKKVDDGALGPDPLPVTSHACYIPAVSIIHVGQSGRESMKVAGPYRTE